MCIKKSMEDCDSPEVTYFWIPEVSRVAGSTFIPTPGFAMLITTRPIRSAIVETISKYNNATPPVLPTDFMLSIPAIPLTTVQKITGAMIILIKRIKASPNGLSCSPKPGICCSTPLTICVVLGEKCPTKTPAIIAIIT